MARFLICFGLILGSGQLLFAQPEDQETVYFAVFIDGKKSGYGEHSRSVKGGHVHTKEGYHLTMNRGDVRVDISLWETSIETLDGHPVGFETNQSLGTMSVEASGHYNQEGVFDVHIKTAGIEQQRKVPLPDGALMAEGLRLKGLKMGLVQGNRMEMKMFTPSLNADSAS